MNTHVWHLPRLGCALQGLLPLLPPTPCVPANGAKQKVYLQPLPSERHLLDDNNLGQDRAEMGQKEAAGEGGGLSNPLARSTSSG